jgi:hypothetical protein
MPLININKNKMSTPKYYDFEEEIQNLKVIRNLEKVQQQLERQEKALMDIQFKFVEVCADLLQCLIIQ